LDFTGLILYENLKLEKKTYLQLYVLKLKNFFFEK